MPWAVLDRLLQLIPSRRLFSSTNIDLQDTRLVARTGHPDGGGTLHRVRPRRDGDARYWTLREQFLPNSYSARTGDLASVIRWSDFYTSSELKNAPFYAEYLDARPTRQVRHVRPAPDRSRAGPDASCSRRSNRDFSERDRLVLQLLRPHLHEVYLDAERRRHGIPHLSRREREVLQLAAQGYSNADIARILFISPATVAKHMEHIFDRTGVRTRSAAAALALPSAPSLRRFQDR